MPTVLITGINGFVAVPTALYFLQHGWDVKGSARTQAKADYVKGLPAFAQYAERLHTFVVEDLPSADWSEVLPSVDAVALVAGPLDLGLPSWESFRRPKVDGTLNLLRQSTKFSNIRGACIVSSTACVIGPGGLQGNVGKHFTHDDWLDYSVSHCESLDPEKEPFARVIWYCAANAENERAALRFAEKQKPHFSVTALVPGTVLGGPIHIADGKDGALQHKDMVTGRLWSVLASGKDTALPDLYYPEWTATTTLAGAIFACLSRQISGRYLVGDGYMDHIVLNRLGHKLRPDLSAKGIIPIGKPEGKSEITDGVYDLDFSRAQKEFNLPTVQLEDVVQQIYEQYEAVGAV